MPKPSVNPKRNEAKVTAGKARVSKRNKRAAQAIGLAYPSLLPKRGEIGVSKSYRMPLSMAEDLECICVKYGIKEESKLVRDFIAKGIADLK